MTLKIEQDDQCHVASKAALQHNTVLALGALVPTEECCACCVLEHLFHTLSRFGRTLKIVLGTNLLSDSHALDDKPHISVTDSVARATVATYLLWGDWPLACPPKLIDHPRITSKVLLAANKDKRETGTEVHDLRNPL